MQTKLLLVPYYFELTSLVLLSIQTLEICHQLALIKALIIILHNGEINNIYNIGTNNEYSVLEIANKIIKYLKPNEKIDDWIEFTEDRFFNDFRYKINNTEIKKLGWNEETNFDIGLKETIDWYLNN